MSVGCPFHVKYGNVARIYFKRQILVYHREAVVSGEKESFDDGVEIELECDGVKKFFILFKNLILFLNF
jgi:hypothetical protein